MICEKDSHHVIENLMAFHMEMSINILLELIFLVISPILTYGTEDGGGNGQAILLLIESFI